MGLLRFRRRQSNNIATKKNRMMAPTATLPAMTFLVEGADRLKATDVFEDIGELEDANGIDGVALTNELMDDSELEDASELMSYMRSANTVKINSVGNSRRYRRC
jgi:hypothetical protein